MVDLLSICKKYDIDLADGCQVIRAKSLAERFDPGVNVSWPLLIVELDGPQVAVQLQATLSNAYPPDHQLILLTAEVDQQIGRLDLTLAELDGLVRVPEQAILHVPPLPPGSDFTDLLRIIAHLRAPVGCPWDREQTLDSLRKDLLSEATEVMEAIDLDSDEFDNADHIAEELGDVLLVVAMLVQIAAEDRRFRMADVLHGIVSKLIRRHPHVFGEAIVNGSQDVVVNWNEIKQREKVDSGQIVDSPLSGIPAHLPALEKARALQSKAAKAGLLDRSALAASMPSLTALIGDSASETSIGELLWTLTAIAREHNVVAEDALRRAVVRYRQRMQAELSQSAR